jgi:MFS family permease
MEASEMSRIASFFGLDKANADVMSLAKTLTMLLPTFAAISTLSTTFQMIFIAESLGNGSYIQGLTLVGVLVVIQMIVQTVLDYPTGAIGDWIGQRYVIASSLLCFAISYYLISLVTISTSFAFLVLIYIMLGLGNSQASGAFDSWFDNNYRVAVPGDDGRKQYGVFMGKVQMMYQLVATLALIPGSFAATLFSRPWVFQVQAASFLLMGLIVLKLLKDLPGVRTEDNGKASLSEYKEVLSSGVRFLFSDNYITLVIIGGTVLMAGGMVWSNLILFPMYYSYLKTDVAVSSFRTLLFFLGILTGERAAAWSKNFEPKKWIPRFAILQSLGFIFYMSFAAITFFLPPINDSEMLTLLLPATNIVLLQLPVASLIPLALMTLTFTTCGFFSGFYYILRQRELLDVIPNKIRNSLYSLSPTITVMIAIPQIAFFGWLIPVGGLPITLAISAFISLIGVVMIKKGLDYPKPIAEIETQGEKSGLEAVLEA